MEDDGEIHGAEGFETAVLGIQSKYLKVSG